MATPHIKYLQALSTIASKDGKELFLVGGFIRDHLLRKKCSDYDFVCSGVQTLAETFAREHHFPLVKLDSTPGRETLRVILEPQASFDFTELQGATIDDDLKQRDFTINALALPLKDFIAGGEDYIDLHRGQSDLKDKIVRAIPGPVLSADPLRMLRAFRFAATLSYKIDANTLSRIQKVSNQIKRTAGERIYHELMLLLTAKNTSHLLAQMEKTGLLANLFPGADPHKNSTDESCRPWINALEILQNLETLISSEDSPEPIGYLISTLSKRHRALLKLAALLSQIEGSPLSQELKSETSKTSQCMKHLRASNSDTYFLTRCIVFQKQALENIIDIAGSTVDESSLYRFVKNSGKELEASLILACAVQQTQRKTNEELKFFQAVDRTVHFHRKRFLPAQEEKVLLDGEDLKSNFNLPPSPLFRIILDQVEEERVLGKLNTRDEALALGEKIIKQFSYD